MANEIMLPEGLFVSYIRFIDRPERTTRTYINNLRQFLCWLKYAGIREPQRPDIVAFRQWLLSEHDAIRLDPASAAGWSYRRDRSGNRYTVTCNPNTAGQYLRSVGQFFRWTAANGYYPNIADNVHAPRIRSDYHRKEALKASDVLAIENTIRARAAEKRAAAASEDELQRADEQGKRLLAIYLLAVCCGLRTVEISRANVRDLETVGGEAVLYVTGKGHTEADEKKILAPEVRQALEDYLKARTDRKAPASPLFVATGNRSGGRRLASTTISKMLKEAMKAAGYDSDRITAHSLRHTAGTNVQEITGNLYLTQKYMRHRTPATTEIYLHNNTEAQEADIARKLYAYYHESEAQLPEGHFSEKVTPSPACEV